MAEPNNTTSYSVFRPAFPNERQTNVNFVPQFPRYVGHVSYPGGKHYRFCFPQDRWKINGAPTAQSDLRNSRLFVFFGLFFRTCFPTLSYFRSPPCLSSLFSTRYKTNRIRQSLVEKRANEGFTKTPKTGQVARKFPFFVDRNELKRCVEANRKFSRSEPFAHLITS